MRPLAKGTVKRLRRPYKRTDEHNPWTRVFNTLNDFSERINVIETNVRNRVQSETIGIEVSGYESVFEKNPVAAVLHELADKGKIKMALDDRNYLADLIVDGVCNRSEATGMGAAIVRRIHVFLKGRLREDQK